MPPISFAQTIRALFRDHDIKEMKSNASFDLSKYEDVCAHAAEIYERLVDGSMPCDAPWTAENIATIKQWMDEGMSS